MNIRTKDKMHNRSPDLIFEEGFIRSFDSNLREQIKLKILLNITVINVNQS